MKNYVAGFIWLSSILFFAWFPEQNDFHLILPSLLVVFLSYIFLYRNQSNHSVQTLLVLAIAARILIIPAFPNLSDDIYRFIWDGRLWHIGEHPFSLRPEEIVNSHVLLNQSLFDNLNSQNYYSIYPPIAQLIFWVSTFFPSESYLTETIIMKGIHCAFDIATIFLIVHLLKKFDIDKGRVLLYALNPLIILEFVGNLHHEGIVIFFILLTLLWLSNKKFVMAGCGLALAIGTKILPIIFGPIILLSSKGIHRVRFFFSCLAACSLLFCLLDSLI